MGENRRYQITLWVEGDGAPEYDPHVIKLVEAADRDEALEKARDRVRNENRDLNADRIWFWTSRRIYGAGQP
jgi:hypothetical protein